MLNINLLVAFIPTFFFVSVTPGLCMMLAMTMGMSIGFRRTLWMMIGELVGVGIVAAASVIGVATIMLKHPDVFSLLKYGGGLYLAYLGISLWRSKGKMAIDTSRTQYSPSAYTLISQGFITAIANPKGWAFFIALLPPFIDINHHIPAQLAALVSIILVMEFCCLCLYALGGGALRKFLTHTNNIALLNRISGSLMFGVALWLVCS